MEAKLKRIEEENIKLTEQTFQAQNASSEVKEAYKNFIEKMKEAQNEIRFLKLENEEANREIKKLEHDSRKDKKEIELLEQKLSTKAKEIAKLKNAVKNYENEQNLINQELEKKNEMKILVLKDEISKLEFENKQLRDTVNLSF